MSEQSVVKHYDAYTDIPWDDPDVRDRPGRSALGARARTTRWARPSGIATNRQPFARRIGLYRYATAMKIGLQFENVLKRGLLEYTFGLPNNDPRFRYAYHELIEEAHHGLMFQEFVNRTRVRSAGPGVAGAVRRRAAS